jgi:multicomponent Na+:H+ antiporter subunit C
LELLLAIVAGVLYASGLYLMLRRRLAQLIIGLGLLSNGSNILILSAAGVVRGKPPLAVAGMTADQFADPVPQSLVLTAIVIGFGVTAFSLVLAHRVQQSAGSDDIDSIGPDSATASSGKPGSAEASSGRPGSAEAPPS